MAKENKEEVCGHINRQYVNSDGELDQLVCELPKGHEGNHQAKYKCFRPTDGSIAQARLIAKGEVTVITLSGKQMIEVVEIGEWSDAAGVLASDVHPDLVQLARIKANKGNMLDEAQIIRNSGA